MHINNNLQPLLAVSLQLSKSKISEWQPVDSLSISSLIDRGGVLRARTGVDTVTGVTGGGIIWDGAKLELSSAVSVGLRVGAVEGADSIVTKAYINKVELSLLWLP